MAQTPEVGDIIEIRWDDASWWTDETTPEDWSDRCEVYTYGAVVKITKRSLFLAAEVQSDSGSYRGVTRIPLNYIDGWRKLGHVQVNAR